MPAFGGRSLGELSVNAIRDFVVEVADELADEVAPGEPAAKTVTNALGTLVVCFDSEVEDGVLAVTLALHVPRLSPEHVEREYLRLDRIPLHLVACWERYRPLAEFALRISEALDLPGIPGWQATRREKGRRPPRLGAGARGGTGYQQLGRSFLTERSLRVSGNRQRDDVLKTVSRRRSGGCRSFDRLGFGRSGDLPATGGR